MCHFKPKNSEIKPYHLLLGNISKGFTVDNMNKCYAYDILGIHKCLTKKNTCNKIIFKFIKQAFIRLLRFSRSLTHLAKVSYLTNCISLNNDGSLARSTLIDLN